MEEKSPTASTGRTSDVDTSSITHSHDQNRERVWTSSYQDVTSTKSGVNVEKAQYEFAELDRQLSSISNRARRLSKHVSGSKTGVKDDVEKIGTSSGESDEPWDLETALHGNRAAEVKAGIRSKHIGEWLSPFTQALPLT